MFGLGPTELIIVFLIILLVFGAKRIPEIAQGLGKGIMEFKRAAREITDEFDTNQSTQSGSSNYTRNELRGQNQAPRPQPQQDKQEQPVERKES